MVDVEVVDGESDELTDLTLEENVTLTDTAETTDRKSLFSKLVHFGQVTSLTQQLLASFLFCFPAARKPTRSEVEPDHTTGATPRKKPGEAKEK